MRKKIIIFCCFIFFSQNLYSQDISIIQKIRSHADLQKQLQDWVQNVVYEWKGETTESNFPVSPLFKQSLAVFVTAKKEGQVKGCMGSLRPRKENLAQEIRENLKLAFTKDPQHRPVLKDEVSGMEIFVSALGSPRLLSKPYQVSPAHEAILMRSGSKEAIALPGEAKTLRYLLAFLKAKAGIGKKENFQLYRLESETVEVILK